jgi:N-glycosylase/DNA lyase
MLTLTPLPPFDFHHAVTGHGWYQLAPYQYDEANHILTWPQRLPGGGMVRVRLSGSAAGEPEPWLRAEIDAASPPADSDWRFLAQTIGWVMNSERDLQPFYQHAARVPGYEKAIAQAQGRFLRSPSLFEDFVKVICTTNTTWGQTKGMVRALIAGWGEATPWEGAGRCFPIPAALAAATEPELRTAGRLGYRAPYVLELAQRLVSGDLDLEGFCRPDLPTPDLRKALLRIKGIGPYAAATLLTLLGHFDYLAVDSWTRKLVIPRYFPDRDDVTDAEIIAVYADWHPFQQLAYWFYDWE